jgi:hypothetical protein
LFTCLKWQAFPIQIGLEKLGTLDKDANLLHPTVNSISIFQSYQDLSEMDTIQWYAVALAAITAFSIVSARREFQSGFCVLARRIVLVSSLVADPSACPVIKLVLLSAAPPTTISSGWHVINK